MQHIKRHAFLIIAILVILGGYLFLRYENAKAPEATNEPNTQELPSDSSLSDLQLSNFARSDFDKAAMMFKEITIGEHNSTPVLVTFPCSDVCPQSTIRIIRYDIEPDQCANINGELKSILVPMAITVMKQEFCFPKPVVEAGVYEFIESS